MDKRTFTQTGKNGIGDNLLIWLKSYLSNRTQRVVIKDALSNIGQRKAGVPQGSVLVPLFLVFINDIADGKTGLGRLFADDTSIGYIANDKPDSLQDMENLEFAYLNDWSKRWLVNFNQLWSTAPETQNFISILSLMVLH